MTTTPDSRIRSDFGLPPGVPTRAQAGHLVDQMTPQLRVEMEAYWARAEPIDTSTTAGKIAVMQAYERGERIQAITLSGTELEPRSKADEYGCDKVFSWDWSSYDYRIAPPPAVPMDPYSRAKRYIDNSKRGVIEGVFCDLVDALEVAPVVMVNMECPSVDQPYPNIYQWISGFDLKPGRYRLLRDDQ